MEWRWWGFHLPFQAPRPMALISSIIAETPAPRLSEHFPTTLADFVAKALSKDRNARFQSAATMLDALRALRAELYGTEHAPFSPASTRLSSKSYARWRSSSVPP